MSGVGSVTVTGGGGTKSGGDFSGEGKPCNSKKIYEINECKYQNRNEFPFWGFYRCENASESLTNVTYSPFIPYNSKIICF